MVLAVLVALVVLVNVRLMVCVGTNDVRSRLEVTDPKAFSELDFTSFFSPDGKSSHCDVTMVVKCVSQS